MLRKQSVKKIISKVKHYLRKYCIVYIISWMQSADVVNISYGVLFFF